MRHVTLAHPVEHDAFATPTTQVDKRYKSSRILKRLRRARNDAGRRMFYVGEVFATRALIVAPRHARGTLADALAVASGVAPPALGSLRGRLALLRLLRPQDDPDAGRLPGRFGASSTECAVTCIIAFVDGIPLYMLCGRGTADDDVTPAAFNLNRRAFQQLQITAAKLLAVKLPCNV